MNKTQQGDVLLYQGPDDGDIYVEGGLVEMTQGFDSMLYIVLSGPNENDDGSEGAYNLQWLGNEDEPEENQIRGKFHQLLQQLPITSGNLGTLQAAAIDDITSAFGDLIDAVKVTVSAISVNSVYVFNELFFSNGTVETFGLELFKK